MALTVFPTVRINSSSTDTDTTASGAGPTTAILGTCATVTNSTTITLNNSGAVNLSTITAQDGSNLLWVSGLGYNRISTFDDATDTVVVETAMTITVGTAWAIGGTLPSLNGTEARRLFAATSGPSTNFGATGQWTISLQSNDTISTTITSAFTTGNGWLDLKSSTPGTLRTLTQSASATHFTQNTVNKFRCTDINFLNSNATPLEAFTISASNNLALIHCLVGNSAGTNCPKSAVIRTNGTPTVYLIDTCVLRTTSHGYTAFSVLYASGSEISRSGGSGITGVVSSSTLVNCIVSHNSGDGLNTSGIPILINNTIHGNTGDGVELTTANQSAAVVLNNQITKNGGWGINMSSTVPHHGMVEYNNFGNASDSTNNTSGTANNFTLSSTNTTVSPQYVDASNTVRNFTVGFNCTATGFPPSTATLAANQSGSTTYMDQGAVQGKHGTPSFASM